MRFLTAIAVTAPLVLATPQIKERASTDNLHVVWHHEKSTSKTSLTLMDESKSKVFGYSCTSSLNTDFFADFPIIMNVTENGSGTLMYGSTTYKVLSDPAFSGGITCSRMYHGEEAYVDCLVPQPDTLKLAEIASDSRKDCFTGSVFPVKHGGHVQNGKRHASLQSRGEIPDWTTFRTELIGDGNPHQNYYHKQLSENIACGGAIQCTVGFEKTFSYSIGFSAGATAYEWLSGGFDVQVSWETGNQYQCSGGPGDTVCIWYNIAHTAYTVRNVKFGGSVGYPARISDPFVMWSPNTGNRGGGYYCIVDSGQCAYQGAAAYWYGPDGAPL